jgi:hypothetical protein
MRMILKIINNNWRTHDDFDQSIHPTTDDDYEKQKSATVLCPMPSYEKNGTRRIRLSQSLDFQDFPLIQF